MLLKSANCRLSMSRRQDHLPLYKKVQKKGLLPGLLCQKMAVQMSPKYPVLALAKSIYFGAQTV